MQGASALEKLKGAAPGSGQELRVFVVWERVLDDDVAPDAATQARVHFPGALQRWDPDRLTAAALEQGIARHAPALAAELKTRVVAGDPIWDALALFEPGQRWDAELPVPVFIDGDVLSVVDAARSKVESMAHAPHSR